MKVRYIFAAMLLVVVGALIFISTFKLKTINITGCSAIDEQEILDAIEAEEKFGNTVEMYFKLKMHGLDNITFLDKLDVEIENKNQLNVTIYEKSMAGCVEYMNYYVYFDKDGIVLATSAEKVETVPCIKGLNFNQWEMGKKLPIDDTKKFQSILTITQLIDKYSLDIDGIEFTSDNEIVLYHDKITIELGEGEYLAIQMMNLGSILDGLEGMEGTLYMKDFDSDNATASFSKN